MDRDFFNFLIRIQPGTVADAEQAEQVVRLYLFLTTSGRRNDPVAVESLEARSEGGRFKVAARLRRGVPPESVVRLIEVAADGSIVADD